VHILGGCAILLLIAVAILGLFAAGLAALKRSARDNPRGSGSLGTAMQEIEGLFVESKKHTVEAQRAEQEEEDESGDPPEK
jgi:hypothetical protein